MSAVYKKELGSYFNNMMGYVIIAFTLLVLGIYVAVWNFTDSYSNFEYTLLNASFLFIVMVPMITMRVFVEEKRQKTDVLLYTSPVSVVQIVAGKYLAMLTVFAAPMLFSCLYPLLFSSFGTVDFKTAYLGIFGFLLLGAALLAVGMFISSLTDSYIVAVISTFAVMLVMYLMDSLLPLINTSAVVSLVGFFVLVFAIVLLLRHLTKSNELAVGVGCVLSLAVLVLYIFAATAMETAFIAILTWLSIYAKYVNFVYGILDLTAVVYYLTVIFLFGFLTVQNIEKRRWL